MTLLELRVTQWITALVGAGLVVVALIVWLPGEPPTISRTVETTVHVTTTPGRAGRPRVTRSEVDRTRDVTTGSARHAADRTSPTPTSRRSALVVAVLAGAGALLMLVGLLLPRLRGGTGPSGTGFQVDPVRLTVTRRVAAQFQADSRLPAEEQEAATDTVLRNLSARRWRWRSAWPLTSVRLQTERAVGEEIKRVVTPLTRPPLAVTGREHYQGDRFESSNDAPEDLIGRVSYWYGEGEDTFDVVATDAALRSDSPQGREQIARSILRHALGNRPVTEAAAERFAADFETTMSPSLWQLPLEQVTAWIAEHLREGTGELRE